MTEHKHTLSQRVIGGVCDSDTEVQVSVSYLDTEGHFDSGSVHLSVYPHIDGEFEEPEDMLRAAVEQGWAPMALLSPGDALVLADRLTRAARVVMESWEDPPDVERELQKVQAEK